MKAPLNVEIGMMLKCNNTSIIKRCDKISVNNVNFVIQQQIASGKHYCISLTKAPLNVEIGMMVKCNTPMINVVIKSL